jgi:meiotically up-regulated gene 157 (Mug157) protein
MDRRNFVKNTALTAAGWLLLPRFVRAAGNDFPVVRVPEGKRKFKSKAVEKLIAEVKKNCGNKELAWLFENCFPNTLDTTVDFEMINGKPDTYVITGDIDAMWLRDSSAQVWPYLPLCKDDKELRLLIAGVINRQATCILKDPYANAFYKDETKISEWSKDHTDMKPGVHERKWEIDSLCYPIRLAHGYWKTTGDASVFDAQWLAAAKLVVQTFREQQRLSGKGPYHFQRDTANPTDSVPLGGYGYPAKPNGMICSAFRPSDDATVYSYLVPANIFAVHALAQLAEIVHALYNDAIFETAVDQLKQQVEAGLQEAKVHTERFSDIYAFETNGYGSYNLMDDANIPSLLSLSYLIPALGDDPTYRNTRNFVLSDSNPFFFKGDAGEGIGGPHVGMDYIWPLSIIMRGLTTRDNAEIKLCLDMLMRSHAGTGFMHEAFHKNDATKFTRSWFAWANTLFGEFVWKVYREKPALLN